MNLITNLYNTKKIGALSIYFSAGVIFDELDMYDKAIHAFKKSSKQISPEHIVDCFLLPNDSVHIRKLERCFYKCPIINKHIFIFI